MRKRKREQVEEEALSAPLRPPKNAKHEEDSFGKLTSLFSSEDSVLAGLTFFLTSVKDEAAHKQKAESGSLLEKYLQRFPDCDHILSPLSWTKERKPVDVLLLCFESLEQILLFTASLPKNASTLTDGLSRTVGPNLVDTLLNNHMRSVYSSLLTSLPMRLVASCLRLLVAMVMQGPESARSVHRVFNFSYKPLDVFPGRTHVVQGGSNSVRECFMNFALSFLIVGESDVIKSILELKGLLSSFFKLLPKDSAETIHLFLRTLEQKVILDPGIPKRTKSLFFNTYVLKQVSQVLTTPLNHSQPTDLQNSVFDFLTKLCTDFLLGICYRRKESSQGLDKTTNPIILNFLFSLTGSLTLPLVQTLVLNTLVTCHDLILPYLRALSMTFDPQPSSKWVSSIGFIIKLFSMLPAVDVLLNVGSDDHGQTQPSLSCLDVGVALTVPVIATRSILSVGLQHKSPIVKYQILQLMKVALTRASDLVRIDSAVERSVNSIDSFLVVYADSALKCLPDIKTMISLNQQLLSRGVATGRGLLTDVDDGLNPSDRLRSAELLESTDLLSLTVEVMRGYQSLLPAIFIQADYNLAKLFPDPSLLGSVGQVPSTDRQEMCLEPVVLCPTLKLLKESPVSSIKWLQKDSHIKSVLWLILNPSVAVSNLAFSLAIKLLVAMESFRGYSCEISVMLLTLVECHTPSPDNNRVLVNFVAKVLLTAVKSKSVIRNSSDEQRFPHLKEILSVPLKLPDPCDGHLTNHLDNSEQSDKMSPLIHSLLSLYLPDRATLEREFIIESVRRLLLVTNSSNSFHLVRDHLGPASQTQTKVFDLTSFLSLFSGSIRHYEPGGSKEQHEELLLVDEKNISCLKERFQLLSVDDKELRCSIRAVSTLLWRLWRCGQDKSVNIEPSVNLLFGLLTEALNKLSVPLETVMDYVAMPTLNRVEFAETEIFKSCLFREVFLLDKYLLLKSESNHGKPKDSCLLSCQQDVGHLRLFLTNMSCLVSAGVRLLPELRVSRSVQFTLEQLLASLLNFLRSSSLDESVGRLLTDLLCELRDCIGSKMAADFIEALILSYKDVSELHLDCLVAVLELLPTCLDHRESEYEARKLCVSDKALKSLVKLVTKRKLNKLDSVVYDLLKGKLSSLVVNGSPLITKKQNIHFDSLNVTEDGFEDVFVSSLNSLTASLLPSCVKHLMITQPSASLVVTDRDHSFLDMVDVIFSRLYVSCSSNPRAKDLIESSRISSHSVNFASSCQLARTCPLSETLLIKLFRHCVQNPSSTSALIVHLLFKMSTSSIEYFHSTLLTEVCETLDCLSDDAGDVSDDAGDLSDDAGDLSTLEGKQLHLLEIVSTYLRHRLDVGVVDSEAETVRRATKMLGKHVWCICSDIVGGATASQLPDVLVGMCSTVLSSLAKLLPKGKRKIEKLLLKWNISDSHWTRTQLSVALSLAPEILSTPSLFPVMMRRLLQVLQALFQDGHSCCEEGNILKRAAVFLKYCLSSPVVAQATDLETPEISKFFHSALKHRFSSPLVLHLLAQLVRLALSDCDMQESNAELLEALYERVWSHSKFLDVMCLSHDQEEQQSGVDQSKLKECLVELLVSMVELRSSLCSDSHVPILLGAYSVSRNRSDRGLLYLLFKYEAAGVSLGKYRPFLWGVPALLHYKQKQEVGWLLWKQPGMQEVVGQLKRDVLQESIKHFPVYTALNPNTPFSKTDSSCDSNEEERGLYDLCFLLPLFSQLLDPSSLVDCRQFIDSGCLGYLMVSLSSTVKAVRCAGAHALSLFCTQLEGSRFREKAQISLLLEILKNSIQEKDLRLPSVMTAFAAKTASLLLHAESPLYAVVSHFLVYKPTLDVEGIPLFSTLLHSSSAAHRREQLWILQLLVSGLRCKEDYPLYRRKKVFEHLLALSETGMVGERCQTLVLELVARGVAIPEVAVDLVLNRGLLTSLVHIQTLNNDLLMA